MSRVHFSDGERVHACPAGDARRMGTLGLLTRTHMAARVLCKARMAPVRHGHWPCGRAWHSHCAIPPALRTSASARRTVLPSIWCRLLVVRQGLHDHGLEECAVMRNALGLVCNVRPCEPRSEGPEPRNLARGKPVCTPAVALGRGAAPPITHSIEPERPVKRRPRCLPAPGAEHIRMPGTQVANACTAVVPCIPWQGLLGRRHQPAATSKKAGMKRVILKVLLRPQAVNPPLSYTLCSNTPQPGCAAP